jgi:hypothetical protein
VALCRAGCSLPYFRLSTAIDNCQPLDFSWHVAATIGHWPQSTLDDPKLVAPGWLSTLLYGSTGLLLVWTIAAFVAIPVLAVALWRRLPRWWTLLLLVLFVAGWLLFKSDPGSRFYWYMD